MRDIVNIRRRLLKPNHPDLAESLLGLAIVQRKGRRFGEAQSTLNDLLRIRRVYRLPSDQSEAETWDVQGKLAIDLKNLDAADAAYAKSYEIYQALPGDQRAGFSSVLYGQALVRLLRDDPSAALGPARRSLELEKALDAGSSDVARAEIVLGRCYLELDQPARARPFLERGHKTLLDLYGREHPRTREAADFLRRLGTAGS